MAALWTQLLSQGSQARVLPWFGGRQLRHQGMRWALRGDLPPEHGWHEFAVGPGRRATWSQQAWADPDLLESYPSACGYLVGNRLIRDGARVDPNPDKFIKQTVPVRLLEPGLERFARIRAAHFEGQSWVFVRQEFPLGPEMAVVDAYLERARTLRQIPGVTPALDLAFRFESLQRHRIEVRRRAEQVRREEEARREELRRSIGSGHGRRTLAAIDFDAAARAALAISGAELLDTRRAHGAHEAVVTFRAMQRRFACVVDTRTLGIIDAGICLEDHGTGERGDTYFTLESLPAVIAQAIHEHRLVIFRQA